MNRLGAATSPYLQQHKDNPVDWWEWDPAAFEEARRRNVPVLLSIGYAACHWCHVMAHESFEDEATAAYLNEHFVSIKVDREERPDVDAVYMQATTSMTGHGGWPMTCVLDHDGNPFFAGTYFPDQPRHGQPAFRQILESLVDAWQNRGDDVRRVAATLRDHLNQQAASTTGSFTPDLLKGAVQTLAGELDPVAGGFRDSPKFPPSMALEFLLRHSRSHSLVTQSVVEEVAQQPSRNPQQPLVPEEIAQQSARRARNQARQILDVTCNAMARGGLYDQLGGGFARYSVDRHWVVPHFEKMLYDNAQLVGLYARWGGPLGERIARGTADFMLRELRTEQGGFASALDADSEGVEGRFYAWTPAQLVDVLGADDGSWAADVLQVTATGTFEHGSSTLQLLHDADDEERLASVRTRLMTARDLRIRPALDDKIVAAWNGLAISGLCDAGLLLGELAYVEAAAAAGRLLVDLHLTPSGPDQRASNRLLLRVSRDGVAGRHAGVLEDHGCVASGFLSLLQATGDPVWLAHARDLLDSALARFRADDGGFFDTASDAEALVARPRDPGDNASPSGLSSMIHALSTYAALTGSGPHRQAAEEALATVATLAERAPRFAGWSLAAAEAMLEGPLEIAVVGAPGPDRDALERRARRTPGAVVVVADGPSDDIPLLQGRTEVDGKPAAYVCRAMVCERPVTDPAELM